MIGNPGRPDPGAHRVLGALGQRGPFNVEEEALLEDGEGALGGRQVAAHGLARVTRLRTKILTNQRNVFEAPALFRS